MGKSMNTLVLRKKLTSSKKITVNLPQLNEGDEVALIVVYNDRDKMVNSARKLFDLEQWANRWETDFRDTIKSTDVETFTGRRF
jgi:hypothetical protein